MSCSVCEGPCAVPYFEGLLPVAGDTVAVVVCSEDCARALAHSLYGGSDAMFIPIAARVQQEKWSEVT